MLRHLEEIKSRKEDTTIPSFVPKYKDMKTYVPVRITNEPIKWTLTYFTNGKIVRAHIMALIPPMTSSLEGTSPVAGQIPFSTYKGEVPISE